MRTLLTLGIVLACAQSFAGNPYYQSYGARGFGGQRYGARAYGYRPSQQNYRSQQSTIGPFTTTRTYGSRGYSSTATETDFGNGQRSYRLNDNRGYHSSGSSTDFGNGIQSYRFHDNRGNSWNGNFYNFNQMGSGYHYRAPQIGGW